MERDGLATLSVAKLVNFNSHAYVERDIGHVAIATGEGISTHTLTWSVTVTPSYVAVTSAISTHTLTWSVTRPRSMMCTTYLISTHTLTWSVTLADFLWNADETISTHTLTWSVTVAVSISNNPSIFQLTRSRGA